MARVKEEEKKEFFISQRKKIGPGITNVPVWIVQKAGKRFWAKKQKRTWKQIGLGNMYKKHLKKQGSKKKKLTGKGRNE